MMNSVQPRGDDDQIQNPFDLNRKTPVGMVKESRSFERDKEDQKHHWRNSEDHYCERKESDGKNHLAKVESRRSAYVQIKIGVMDVMKPPEDWNHMVRPMPPPVGVIHQEKRGNHSSPRGKSKPI